MAHVHGSAEATEPIEKPLGATTATVTARLGSSSPVPRTVSSEVTLPGASVPGASPADAARVTVGVGWSTTASWLVRAPVIDVVPGRRAAVRVIDRGEPAGVAGGCGGRQREGGEAVADTAIEPPL
ncbi:MAG: hypothetical protein U0P45_02990 [Acidimicrobiales bacterium]